MSAAIRSLLAHLIVVTSLFAGVTRARAEAQPRTMLVVAHHDDDLLMLYPDMRARLNARTPFQTVYLTNGNAGLKCTDYTLGREAGAREVHAKLLGVPNEWKDEERVIGGKLLRVSTLVGTQHTLWFFGFPNSPEDKTSLEYLWSTKGARLSTMAIDGRSRTDSYSAEELIETLKKLMVEVAPEDIRTLDASRRQPEFYPFEHTDHVHSALFAFSALERYGKAEHVNWYRSYNIQLEKENLEKQVIAEREALFKAYAVHDQKICETGKTTICGEEVRCYPLGVFLPFMHRNYTIDMISHADTALFTKFGRCMKVKQTHTGSSHVTMKRCGDDDPSYHWKLDEGGHVKHLATGLCLAAEEKKLGSALTLAECKEELAQRFYLNTQGQLRGPNASCVRSGLRDPELQKCGWRIRQTNWRAGRR